MIDECWKYENGVDGTEVKGCYFKYLGHVCNEEFMRGPIIDFMKSHPKPSID